MTYRALIPVKALAAAKSRLALHLTHEQRIALVLEMLHHVIVTLRDSALLETIAVVSQDATVLERADHWGARAHLEELHGHNPALHAAALHELETGATALLTLSADLPLLQTHDIGRMVAQSSKHDVVLAASQDHTGTNALLVRPPLAVPYLFGPGSLQRYLAEAEQRHLSSTVYVSTSTALDIDTIDDLKLFQRYIQLSAPTRAAQLP